MPVIDRLRRRGVLPVALLILAAPALASCGFDYPTDRVNTIAPGVNDRSGDVKVLGAVVVADKDGSGVFLASLTNSGDDPAKLDDLTSDDGVSIAGSAPDVEVAPGGHVSLIQEGGIPVQGDFAAGDFVQVTLSFDNGQSTSIDVNVLPPCRQYSPEKLGDLKFPDSTGSTASTSGESESAEPESTESESTESESTESESTESESTESESAEGGESEPDAYSCETYESDVWKSGEEPHHGGGEE